MNQQKDSSKGWQTYTPTWTGGIYKRRTLWQWLTRKPRQFKTADVPVARYKQRGKTIYYEIGFETNQPKTSSRGEKHD